MNEKISHQPSLEQAWNRRRDGDPEGAAHELDQVLERARAESDHETAIHALICQAHLAQDRDDISSAVELAREALQTYQHERVSNRDLLAHAHRHLADFQRRAGYSEEALANYEQALAAYRALHDEESLSFANTVRGYALALEGLGREEDAVEQWRIAADVYGDVGVPGGMDEAKARIAGDQQDLDNQKTSGA